MKKIKVENLKIGDCIKNYKELCRLLEQPVYSGNQKKAQIEEFKRYFEFDKVGVKFYINDIYETPLTKEYKYPPNVIYAKYIECILLHYLSTQPNKEVIIPSQNLYLQLGMVNHNFISMQRDKKPLLNLSENMNMQIINDFYKRCKFKLYRILTTSLESLEKRRLLISHKVYMIRHSDEDSYKIASPDETELILKIDREILEGFGFDRMDQVFAKNLESAFYSKRNERLYEEDGIIGAYEYWHIIHNCENTTNAISVTELQLKKLMLNDEIVKYINNQAVTKYEKYGKNNNEIIEELIDIDIPEPEELKKQFDFYKNYIGMQLLLSDKLLKLENTGKSTN